MSGLDVAGLLNRLVDRQRDDLQQAVQQARAGAAKREKQLKVEAEEQQAVMREKEARAEAHQREQAVKSEARKREQEAKAEVRAVAKAEALQREKQIRNEVEKELEIDRLRRKLAKKEAKERQPQLSSATHLVRAPTPVGLTEEELVAVLNREMDQRRQEEEQRAMEARRIQQMETERLRRQSLESTGPCLEVPPTVVSVSPVDTRASGLTASQEQRVVDEYYDRDFQLPQALAITQTLGADSQGSQETTSVGVPVQSVIAKPSAIAMPMLWDTPVKASPVMSTTAQSSSIVTDTPTAAPLLKLTPIPDVTMPGSTTTSIPVRHM